MLHSNQENGIINGLAYRARCANPTTSTTNIELPELSGFGNDYFNQVYYLQVIKNNDSVGNAPEGDEPRKITDYVSATGTFTVDAFSAAVGVQDEVLVLHESIVKIENLTDLIVADFVLSDKDDFDVADADADTVRWDVEYITGTEGGAADINTTTAGKLMVTVDPDATPTEARYAVSHSLPFYADYFTVTADLNTAWGATDSATPKAAGMIFSAGSAYDATNYLAVERQKGTAINRFTVSGKLNNVSVTTTSVNTTDDAVAFKVQRLDNVWRFFYSSSQSPAEDWVLISQIEDPSVYMTNQITLYMEAYSKGTADTESVVGDFDNFRYLIGSGGGGQYIAGDYSSAWATRDEDGNVLERLEDIKEDIRGTGGIATFPAAVNIGDGVSLAEAIRAILTSMVGGDDFDNYTNISNSANASLNAVAQKFATLFAADGVNVFNPTIQGAARTDLELAFNALATYLSDTGAAYSATVDPGGTARTCVETTLEDLGAVLAGAGITTFPAAANAGDTVSLAEVIRAILHSIVGGDDYDGFTNISNSANASLDAIAQKFAAVIGIDAANTFDPAMFGGSQTTVEAAFAALATKLTTGAAVDQIASTTEDLNQAAASYDLFTGTTQPVILEALTIKGPTGAAGGALTSISIQTDDATPSVVISSTLGAVANLTSEFDLGWSGEMRIDVGTKIQLTIAGGAHGSEYITKITAKYKAITAGGTLA